MKSNISVCKTVPDTVFFKMHFLFLLQGCDLSCVVDLFAVLHELASARARTLLKLAFISARASLKPYGTTLIDGLHVMSWLVDSICNNQDFSPLGVNFYFYANYMKKFSFVLYTNMVAMQATCTVVETIPNFAKPSWVHFPFCAGFWERTL